MPGDERPAFAHTGEARQVLNDAEQELQSWQSNLEPIQKASAVGANAMPDEGHQQQQITSPTSVKSTEVDDSATLQESSTVAEPAVEKKEPVPA